MAFRYSKPRRIRIRGQLSEHFYCRRYDTLTGKRSWISTDRTNREAAYAQKQTWEKEDASGKGATVDRLFREAVAEWLELKKAKMSERGHSAYAHHCAGWTAFFPEKAMVRDINVQRVEGYFKARATQPTTSRGRPPTAATLNKIRRQLRQFFAWAGDRGWWDGDPPTKTIAKFQETKREIRALEPDEEAALLAACRGEYRVTAEGVRKIAGGKKSKKPSTWTQKKTTPPWLHPFVFLALRTGLRYGNIVLLLWDHVDFRKKCLRIPPEDMKTQEGLNVPIGDETVEFLRELKKTAESVQVLPLPSHSDVRRALRLAARRAGIAPLRIHDLRATFITNCRRKGIDIEAVAQLVGHKDVQTTLRFYRKVAAADLRAAVEKLEGKPPAPAGSGPAASGA